MFHKQEDTLYESNLDVGFEKINHQKEYLRFQMKQIFILGKIKLNKILSLNSLN